MYVLDSYINRIFLSRWSEDPGQTGKRHCLPAVLTLSLLHLPYP